MTLRIKDVKACRNGAFGNYLQRGYNSAVITISLRLNKTLDEYAATLLHELMHLWFTMMRRKGLKITDKREHKYIEAIEETIQKIAKKEKKV